MNSKKATTICIINKKRNLGVTVKIRPIRLRFPPTVLQNNYFIRNEMRYFSKKQRSQKCICYKPHVSNCLFDCLTLVIRPSSKNLNRNSGRVSTLETNTFFQSALTKVTNERQSCPNGFLFNSSSSLLLLFLYM